MTPPILVTMDSNENMPDNKRPDACKYVTGQSQDYYWQGFREIPVDMKVYIRDEDPIRGTDLFNISESAVHIELKEISDFWSSKNTGHLGQQIMTMIAEGQPGFVAVFGSVDEVLSEVPTCKTEKGRFKARSRTDIASDVNTARALSADALGCNVPIFFLSRNYERSFKWILSHAKAILTGPNMASWLPRFGCDPIGYCCLVSIPGIGDAAAKAILAEFDSLGLLAQDCREDPDSIAEIPVNGKRLGKAKASKLIEVFG